MSLLRLPRPALLPLALLAFATGCNMLTGADQFVIDGDSGDTSDGGSTATGNSGSGSNTGSGNGDAGVGGGDAGGSTGQGPVATEGDATGASISKVAVYQAVESVVYQNGASQSPSVDLVANRPAVVRVFAQSSGATGAPITVRLKIGDQAPLEQVVDSLDGGSDASYGSTVNFDVPASMMVSGAPVTVELKEPAASSAGPNPAASTGPMSWALRASHSLKVTIIPVRYAADGSNRMPDTSANQLEAYRNAFMRVYPATDVIISVGQPFTWNGGIDASGNGWDTLLNAISEERSSANTAFDEYFYGAFEPSGSFEQFCGGGCVAGLGFIGDPNGEYSRAAIGLGYSGDVATSTAVHEVGHNHGRPHSPCGGVSGADPGYPHAGGDIGVWGMDIFSHQMVQPSYKDFMGYCDPTWISDYVYEEILDFMTATGGQQLYVPAEAMNQTYERIAVGGSSASFMQPMFLERPPMGTQQTVTITTEDGQSKTVVGSYFAYDHLPGGVLFVKREAQRIDRVALSLDLAGSVIVHAQR